MTNTILIVDDNPDDIEITRRILARTGRDVKVESAAQGEAALELLRHLKDLPALIFLDLKMPGMSGIDTLREIRADARLKDVPVIIVTCSSLESDEREAYAAGANSFLHKAFDIDQFGRDMNSLLERCLRN